jgi:lactoylglutathione lyase
VDQVQARFRAPQVNFYVEDVERSVAFFRDHLDFVETFRTPETGTPDHVELRLEGLVLGFGSVRAAREIHGLPLDITSPSAEVVLWTDQVDNEYERLLTAGARSISAPHIFVSRLRAAFLAGPNGEHIQIVSELTKCP